MKPYCPYVGEKHIKGQGGFPERWYFAEELGLGKRYPNSGVGFWASGLPDGQKCRLIGYAQSANIKNVAKAILKSGGNIATQSSVSFPISFEKDGGVLNVSSGAGPITVQVYGAGTTTRFGYNAFYCTE